MPLRHHAFLFLAALIAGAVNSVAGGGSFISFPALLFTGMAPIAANATNTVALWPGTMASTVAYRNAFGPESRRFLWPLIATGVIGGILGARLLLGTPQQAFVRLIPWLLLLATLLFVFSGRMTAWVLDRADHNMAPAPDVVPGPDAARASANRPIPRTLVAVVLFLELIVAIYVGYFGAGSGILMLSLLPLLGIENIHAMNGMKTLLVSIVNGVASVTFILARVIVWPEALVMLVAAAAGGYGGAYLAQKMNPHQVRWLVIVIGFGMSAYFFIRN